MMKSRYVEWLQRQGVPLFKAGNMYWCLYQGALVPALATPCFIELRYDEAKDILKGSGAWFLRYSSEPCDNETEWWYILCDKYDPKKISSKTRQNINRGKRKCSVRIINVEWLAKNGYECYFAAFSRYKNATPVSEEEFRKSILKTKEGPFEYWGVFMEGRLAGYCQCIVDGNDVVTSVTKYDPNYLRHRTTYSLINSLINHYVVDHNMVLSNGTRSIAHDTNYQDVLINLGFRKQFCRLNVVYHPWLEIFIQTLYPLRKLIGHLPNRGLVNKMQSILVQEKLRRAFDI